MPVQDAAPADNWAYARQALAQAAAAGAHLALLPELWTTGLAFPQAAVGAEPIPQGETIRRLRAWSRAWGLWIVGSLLERDAQGRLFNSALAVGPQGQMLPPYRNFGE